MAHKKCPLCGGKILNGSCSDCGYSMPDEELISSVYNYDPSDYNIKEQRAEQEREMSIPEVSADVIPNVNNQPNIQPVENNELMKPETKAQNENPYADFSPTENNNNPKGNKLFGTSSNANGLDAKSLIIKSICGYAFPAIGVYFAVMYGIAYGKSKDKNDLISMIVVGAVVLFRYMTLNH